MPLLTFFLLSSDTSGCGPALPLCHRSLMAYNIQGTVEIDMVVFFDKPDNIPTLFTPKAMEHLLFW
jgi:hypothetical protein